MLLIKICYNCLCQYNTQFQNSTQRAEKEIRHTTQIELGNQYDLVAVTLGVMNPEDVRRLTVTDALILCLDIKEGLIYNPAHDGEWITEIL